MVLVHNLRKNVLKRYLLQMFFTMFYFSTPTSIQYNSHLYKFSSFKVFIYLLFTLYFCGELAIKMFSNRMVNIQTLNQNQNSITLLYLMKMINVLTLGCLLPVWLNLNLMLLCHMLMWSVTSTYKIWMMV